VLQVATVWCDFFVGTLSFEIFIMAKQVDKVSIRVLVEKGKNKVVYAEAGKDFVDVLFSFLTLPLGTIARLVAKESNMKAVQFGSISSLYQSVSDLDQQHLWSQVTTLQGNATQAKESNGYL
jgi:4-aminobutyrate aminotransferase-like enzyme